MQSTFEEVASPLDIIFMSYEESNADENWLELKTRFPRAKRVHGVRGIAKAHQQAALKSDTNFFYIVDGDNRILPQFNFELSSEKLCEDTLYVFRCLNPVTQLIYGFGAVKIYNKKLLEMEKEKPFVDLATTVAAKYHIVHELASETIFFNTPEEAWRGAFRECAKLAAGVIKRGNNKETLGRLEEWCSTKSDIANSEWVLLGARQGREFAEKRSNELAKINDYNWLKKYYGEREKK